MTADLEHVTQWQTLQIATAVVTPLTDYRPGELTAAVKAKMIKVAPATAVIIQPLVLGSDGNSFALTISGWMDFRKNDARHGGASPGLRLFEDTITASFRVWGAADIPLTDGKWGAAAVWRLCDWAGAVALDTDLGSAHVRFKVNEDSLLILPTLGYSYLLPEITTMTGVTKVGLLWRPISLGNVLTKTHAFS